MFGLAIAALIVAWCYFISGMALTSAIMTGLVFIWWLTAIVAGIVGLCLLIGGAAIGSEAGGAAGAAMGVVAGGVIGALLMCIPLGLTLGGVYIMYHALDGHVDFSTVPQPDFAIGAIMYGIAVLMNLASRGSSSKSSD